MKDERQDAEKGIAKCLSANDLGRTGSHQAGILIPKRGDLLSFFPPLDPNEKNPRVNFDAIIQDSNERVCLTFVYYNNKLHGEGTRNEFRLTGLTRPLRVLAANVGDTLVIRRLSPSLLHLSLRTCSEPQNTVTGISKTKSESLWTIIEI
jgi:hypothetical protein